MHKNSLDFIFNESQMQKDKEAKPNRVIDYVLFGSSSYNDIIAEKKKTKAMYMEDCKFDIEPLYVSIMNRAVDDKQYTFTECLHFIYRILYFQHNNCCILNFNSTKPNVKSTEYKSYGNCAFETCNRYIIIARKQENGSFSVEVKTTNKNLTHLKIKNKVSGEIEILQKSAQVKGPLRDIFMNMLQNRKVYAVRNIELQKSSKYLLSAGTSEVPSDTVMRRVKSQRNYLEVSHRDPYIELEIMKSESSFIVYLNNTNPFCMYLRNDTLVDIAAEKGRKQKLVSYFDASGQLCGHPEDFLNRTRVRKGEDVVSFKRVLFYPLVVKLNGNLLPLTTMVTDDHTATNIASFLEEFKNHCISKEQWPIVKKINIDFSTALIYAINLAFNNLSGTIEYLKKMFGLMRNNMDVEDDFIVPHGCCSHFAKIVSNDIDRFATSKKKVIPKNLKKMIQESMALGTTLYMWNDIWDWWRNFIIIFESKYLTAKVEKSLEKITDMIKKNTNDDELAEKDNDPKLPKDLITSGKNVIYKSSPFYKLAIKIINEEKKNCGIKADCRNPYYIQGIALHYAKKYMFNLPLWTNYFGFRVDNTCAHDSNASGEAFFHLFKDLQANRERNVRPARFVEHLNDVCEGGVVKCSINSLGVYSSTKSLIKKIEVMNTPTTSSSRIVQKTPTSCSSAVSSSSTPRTYNRNRVHYEGDIKPEDEGKSVESWGPKRPKSKSSTYYDGKRLLQAAKILKKD